MPVTQKDIARAVGVSQATVSDVLHGRPRGRVSDETRRRIFETARRLAYRPNASAQALRTRQSHQIVYATTQAADRQFDVLGEGIIGGLARAFAERNYRLVIEVAASPEQEVDALRSLVSGGVCDGFVVRAFEERHPAWEALPDLGPPFILIGQCTDPRFASIAHDVPGMVDAALRLLADRRHRRVGMILERQEDVYHRLFREAWLAAASAFGFEVAPFTVECAGLPEAEAVAQRWLSLPEAPTALFCVGERPTFGVTRAAARASRRLGDGFDLVATGSGAHRWLYEPGIWYFATNLEAIGRRAAAELARLVDGHPSPGAIRVLPELVQI